MVQFDIRHWNRVHAAMLAEDVDNHQAGRRSSHRCRWAKLSLALEPFEHDTLRSMRRIKARE
jgi:hypothetical protein